MRNTDAPPSYDITMAHPSNHDRTGKPRDSSMKRAYMWVSVSGPFVSVFISLLMMMYIDDMMMIFGCLLHVYISLYYKLFCFLVPNMALKRKSETDEGGDKRKTQQIYKQNQ